MAKTSVDQQEKNLRSVVSGIQMYNQVSREFGAQILDPKSFSRANGEAVLGLVEDFLSGVTDNFVWTSMNGYTLVGKEAVKKDMVATFETLPGAQIILPLEAVATDDDKVMLQYDMVGEYLCGFMGLPSMRQPYRVKLAVTNTFNADGKRASAIFTWNPLDIYFQMGYEYFPVLGGGSQACHQAAEANYSPAFEQVGAHEESLLGTPQRGGGLIRLLSGVAFFPLELLSQTISNLLERDTNS